MKERTWKCLAPEPDIITKVSQCYPRNPGLPRKLFCCWGYHTDVLFFHHLDPGKGTWDLLAFCLKLQGSFVIPYNLKKRHLEKKRRQRKFFDP